MVSYGSKIAVKKKHFSCKVIHDTGKLQEDLIIENSKIKLVDEQSGVAWDTWPDTVIIYTNTPKCLLNKVSVEAQIYLENDYGNGYGVIGIQSFYPGARVTCQDVDINMNYNGENSKDLVSLTGIAIYDGIYSGKFTNVFQETGSGNAIKHTFCRACNIRCPDIGIQLLYWE